MSELLSQIILHIQVESDQKIRFEYIFEKASKHCREYPEEFKKILDDAINEIVKDDGTQGTYADKQCWFYFYRGWVNLDTGNYIDGWRDFQEAEALFKNSGIEVGEIRSISSQGYACLMLGNTEEAFARLNLALERSTGFDDPNLITGILNNIGETLIEMKQYNEAILYLKRALDRDGILVFTKIVALNNIGIAHRKSKDLEKSIKYHTQALELAEEHGLSNSTEEVIKAFGVTLYLKKEFSTAIEYFEKSIFLSKKCSNQKNLGECYLYLGKIYRDLEDFILSEKFYQNGLAISQNIQVPALAAKIYKELASLYMDKKKWKEALDNYILYHRYEKEFFGETTLKQMIYFREEQAKREAAIYKDLYKKISFINEDLESERNKLETALKEITGKNQELEKAYHDLKSAQSQLLQAEKMQSVGRLAAGVAHEINTPIQFVGDNTRFVQESFKDIKELIVARDQVMEAAAKGECTPELIEKAQYVADEIDFEYLKTEIPRAISQSLDGIDRVANIVGAMKNFSHPGNDQKEAINLNKAIENTTILSSSEWKYDAELELDLEPQLPHVHCLAGEINQMILNIIINAAQAIQQKKGVGGDEKGKIHISTRLQGSNAVLRISDSGTGIEENIRKEIFDPFFTTKEVGQGTGQGLAIAYSIVVDKHGGTIDVESEVGSGTTFIISLPVDEKS